MAWYIIKIALTAIVIVVVSEISKRLPLLGSLIASLPLISVLGMIWIFQETKDSQKIITHAEGTFWYVLTILAHVSSHALDDEKRCFFLFVAWGRNFANDYSLCDHDKITVPIWSEHLVHLIEPLVFFIKRRNRHIDQSKVANCTVPASRFNHNGYTLFKFNFIVIEFQNSFALQDIINFGHFFMVMHSTVFGNSHDVKRSGLFRIVREMPVLFHRTGKVVRLWMKNLQLCSSFLRSYTLNNRMTSC